MQYKRLGLIATGVVALAAGALVFAHAVPGHHGHMGGGAMTERFQAHVKEVLAEADATPEQKSRIDAIVATAAADLEALHRQHEGSFAKLHEIFTAPVIDRGKLEQLRAEHIADMDAASQRCATALADAAEVLTPAQRAKLGARMRQMHGGKAHGG